MPVIDRDTKRDARRARRVPRSLLIATFGALLCAGVLVTLACGPGADAQTSAQAPGHAPESATRERPERWGDPPVGETVTFTDAQWRTRLTPLEYDILRHEGTERAFTGAFNNNHADGIYRCAGCGAPLFSSDDKFDSHTGWPSYTRAIAAGRVATRRHGRTRPAREAPRAFPSGRLGVVRTEVHCARCGGHLGHVFPDGPPPTGQRYCIDSASLDFEARAAH